MSSAKDLTEAAFREVNANTPKSVSYTAKKYGPDRAKRQKTAIALSKARKLKRPAAKLPKGGRTF